MPYARISLRKGKSKAYLTALSDGVHQALVERFEVPPDDRFQILHQLEPEELVFDRGYLGGPRSDDFVHVAITTGRHRTAEVKRSFYARLVELLAQAPGIGPEDVLVVISESGPEDWSFGGGRPWEAAGRATTATTVAGAGQVAFGDVAPRFGELTDDLRSTPAGRPPPAQSPGSGEPDRPRKEARTMSEPAVTRKQLLRVDATAALRRIESQTITLGPGVRVPRHTHPCGVVGCVLSGTIRYAREGTPENLLGPGDAFHEPANALVLHFDNASDTEPATFVAFYLVERDGPTITLLE